MTADQFYERVTVFLTETSPDFAGRQPTRDQDLIKTGVLDSHTIINLILYVEELSDREISLDELTISGISSLAALYATYFPDPTVGP